MGVKNTPIEGKNKATDAVRVEVHRHSLLRLGNQSLNRLAKTRAERMRKVDTSGLAMKLVDSDLNNRTLQLLHY